MKKLFLLTATLITLQLANAQETDKPKKSHFLFNAGTQFTDFDALEKNKNLYLGVEYKFKNDLSIGLKYTYSDLSYAHGAVRVLGAPKENSFQLQFNNDWSEKIGLNTEKFDVYTGISVGYSILRSNEIILNPGMIYPSSDRRDFFTGGQIGFRYFFTKRLGFQTEWNMNNRTNYVTTGLTFKL